MRHLRFIMIGGFLGAGKTTAMTRLARYYVGQGQRIGLVTNDQAQDLVDTTSLRAQGFPVEEVAGACFCCSFDDLLSKVQSLDNSERPDVILAEPVGSCTDLVATVVQPLKDLFREQFLVAPYAVLFKPGHGLRIMRNDTNGGFSPKAAYIFRKQLEEADAILINRVDELAAGELAELTGLLAEQFPDTPALPVSAKTGQGFDAVVELMHQDGNFGRKILDIDYDTYAEGEAELGWLNATATVRSARAFDLNRLLLDIVGHLRDTFMRERLEVAHLKTIGLGGVAFGVANLVGGGTEPELSLPSNESVTEAEIIVNARVAADPGMLEQQVRRTLAEVCGAHGCRAEIRGLQSFRPGRPMPTHRYALAK